MPRFIHKYYYNFYLYVGGADNLSIHLLYEWVGTLDGAGIGAYFAGNGDIDYIIFHHLF
jgi:hypothetical protein